MLRNALLAATLTALSFHNAQAQDFMVVPSVEHQVSENDAIDKDEFPSLNLRWNFSDYYGLGLTHTNGNFNSNFGSSDVDFQHNRLDMYRYGTSKGALLRPYIAASVGERMIGKDDSYVYNLGGGVVANLTDNFGVVMDIRRTHDIEVDQYGNVASLGFTLSFGGSADEPVKLAVEPVVEEPVQAVPAPAVINPMKVVVEFGFDSADLTGVERDKLNRAFTPQTVLDLNNTTTLVQVAGFADAVGDEAYNMMLSKQRAEAVAEHLILLGLEARNVEVSFFGEQTSTKRSSSDRIVVVIVE